MNEPSIGADLDLPGELRDWGGNILYVDLIPRTCWFTSARSALSDADWKRLAARIRQRAGFACEICGFSRATLDVHERWRYHTDAGRYRQELVRLIALCKWCHGATHMGFAEVNDRGPQMLRHLARVNRWSMERAQEHRDQAFARWQERSEHLWDLDLGLLERAGYQPKRMSAEAREHVADREFAAIAETNHHVGRPVLPIVENPIGLLAQTLLDPPHVPDAVIWHVAHNPPQRGSAYIIAAEFRADIPAEEGSVYKLMPSPSFPFPTSPRHAATEIWSQMVAHPAARSRLPMPETFAVFRERESEPNEAVIIGLMELPCADPRYPEFPFITLTRFAAQFVDVDPRDLDNLFAHSYGRHAMLAILLYGYAARSLSLINAALDVAMAKRTTEDAQVSHLRAALDYIYGFDRPAE